MEERQKKLGHLFDKNMNDDEDVADDTGMTKYQLAVYMDVDRRKY